MITRTVGEHARRAVLVSDLRGIFERQDIIEIRRRFERFLSEKWQNDSSIWSFALSQMKLSPLANGCAVNKVRRHGEIKRR